MRPRREFSPLTKRLAFARSGGVCECHLIPHVFEVFCGLPLGQGNTFYEHIVCDGAGGDPTIENCAVLTRGCYRFKTDAYDMPHVADTKRLTDRAHGIKALSAPIPGSKRSGIKIPLAPYSDPIDRATGLPWRGR